MESVRVRFAPSPTGLFHIGSARTALFNWLYARHTGGDFHPAHRGHRRRAQQARIRRGHFPRPALARPRLGRRPAAGRRGQGRQGPLFSEPAQRDLQTLRRPALCRGQGLRERTARSIPHAEDADHRARPDLRQHPVRPRRNEPDLVIQRKDGTPVFHLVNVVDDIEMDVTHVIRGEDHLSNTQKHLALIEAFGAKPPHYAHIPLILNPNGSKMSKRDAGASIADYEEQGYLPEAVRNYLCLLGWSPKDNREVICHRGGHRKIRSAAGEPRQRALRYRQAFLDQRRVYARRHPRSDRAAGALHPATSTAS